MTAATAPSPNRRRPAGETIRGADLFASGVYRGQRYTVADLDQIARNFTRCRPLLDPPAVLGHEEHQEYLERTDLPAAGWVDRVWVDKYVEPSTGRLEATLKGDLVGVPAKIAELIRSGRFRKVSAEIYDDFTDDYGRRYGKALRRVAFLGAEVPQVKRLGDLPAPTAFAERTPRRHPHPVRLTPAAARPTRHGTTLCFAERSPMDRSQMIQAVLAAMPGVQPATLDAMSDDQLADLVKNLPQPSAPPAAPVAAMADAATMTREELLAAITGQGGEDPAGLDGLSDDELRELYTELGLGGGDIGAMADDPAGLSRADLVAELTALGEDPAALEKLTDDELRAKYAEKTAAPAATPTPQPAAAMSETEKRMLATERRMAASLARVRKQERELRANRVNQFCERLVKENKLLPRDVPFTRWALLRANDERAVHKFTDGQAKTGTELDCRMAELAARSPLGLFSERLPGSAPKAGEAKEVAAVRRFAVTQAEALRKAGYATPDQYVAKFAEMQKKQPGLTAKAYGIPDEFYA